MTDLLVGVARRWVGLPSGAVWKYDLGLNYLLYMQYMYIQHLYVRIYAHVHIYAVYVNTHEFGISEWVQPFHSVCSLSCHINQLYDPRLRYVVCCFSM